MPVKTPPTLNNGEKMSAEEKNGGKKYNVKGKLTTKKRVGIDVNEIIVASDCVEAGILIRDRYKDWAETDFEISCLG